MRAKDLKKVGLYLKRILKDPFSKQSRMAMLRYFKEGFNLIGEKISGLDFSMVYQCDNYTHNHNYSKTPKNILNRVFSDIDFSKQHNFLDIGCGKGYVLAIASEYPFTLNDGIEYDAQLTDIGKRNLKKLKLDNCNIFNVDATKFEKYTDYDIYYLCNPFDSNILTKVLKRIAAAHKDTPCIAYYLNPYGGGQLGA